ncbi:hypothetical protein IU444_24510 [Nocardia farcinica]|uniref:hypothetical protein n=1 Tax=Nocardia farcinica TaxID=37329 RepID=UPI001893E5B3|nr:hypothetical protein [Nocardia farcinica]MBF6387293.1 hypothetical protein [Nocardia farcinica]
MTVEHPIEDEVTQLARRVEKARGRLAYQFDPALTEALSEDELRAERELAERIREQDREQRWKEVQAAAVASDRARQTAEEIAKADMRDLLLARKAIAAQRRESSPHAKLASLYRHRSWSLRALAGVVAAGMLWSAVNVQHNIAPGGPGDPLYWFSYLLEGMISVCLIIIMIGTNKVAEWGVVDNRKQVAAAEIALLSLTVVLNTYPYLRAGQWYEVGVHAIAPVMIGVALLIHDAASSRYGLAIYRATEQVRELPDPAEQIRNSLPSLVAVRSRGPIEMVPRVAAEAEIVEQADPDVDGRVDPETGEPLAADEAQEAPAEGELVEAGHRGEPADESAAPAAEKSRPKTAAPEKKAATPAEPTAAASTNGSAATHGTAGKGTTTNGTPAKSAPAAVKTPKPAAPATKPLSTSVPATAPIPTATGKAVAASPNPAPNRAKTIDEALAPVGRPAVPGRSDSAMTAKVVVPQTPAAAKGDPSVPPPVAKDNRSLAKDSRTMSSRKSKERSVPPPDPDGAYHEVVRSSGIYDTGQFRIAEALEQELAEMAEARRRARSSRQRLS